jgi:hypothetical protein
MALPGVIETPDELPSVFLLSMLSYMAVRGLFWLFTEIPPRVIFSLIAFMVSSDMVLLGLAVFGVLLSSILEDPSVTVFVAPMVTVVGVDCLTAADDGFLVPTTTVGDENDGTVVAVGRI